MNKNNLNRGFSLVEILCVIAIIATLAALLFPVLAASKGRAYEASSLSSMRQVIAATLLYEQDNEEFPVGYYADRLVTTGYLKEASLLSSPADPFDGMVSKQAKCIGKATTVKVSYHWPFEPFGIIWKELKRVDSNPGIFATLIFSDRTRHFTTDPEKFCDRSTFMYDHKVLRGRVDGSAKFYPFSLKPESNRAGATETFRFVKLFTDEPTKYDAP